MVGSVPVYCGAFKQVFAQEGFVQCWFSNMHKDVVRLATYTMEHELKLCRLLT